MSEITYPGGKAGSGVYQKIINQIPPHNVYIEPFLGGGAILRFKRPAPTASIGIDADETALTRFDSLYYQATLDAQPPRAFLVWGDAIKYLASCHYCDYPSTFVYCDPPYLMETRSTQERIYAHEFSTRAEHARLLDLLKGLKCMVAISGYPCAWYDQQLSGWRAIQFTAMTRSGTAVEKLWMNYPEPVKLHDYRYLGEDYRERERIKKKKTRWNNRLSSMPAAERYALLDTINELWGGDA